MTAGAKFVCVAGIDPGAAAGLVCLAVPVSMAGAVQADALPSCRWVGSTVLHASTRKRYTPAESRGTIYQQARDQLLTWGVRAVAIERPADNLPRGWKSASQGTKQQRADTGFGIGEAYGLLLAAAVSTGAHVHAYPCTSRDAKEGKPARVGWMPMAYTGHLRHVQKRDITLHQLHQLSLDVRDRPHDGVWQPRRDRPELDENVRMALGVLRFHLTRQPVL